MKIAPTTSNVNKRLDNLLAWLARPAGCRSACRNSKRASGFPAHTLRPLLGAVCTASFLERRGDSGADTSRADPSLDWQFGR